MKVRNLSLAVGAMLVPALAVADEPPETYVETHAWNAPVFTTGAILFAGSYGASALIAHTSDHDGADWLNVPVVGPWLAIEEWGQCPIDKPRCDLETRDRVLLLAGSAVQAAGLFTMVAGLLSPTSRIVTVRRAEPKIRVRPTHNGFVVLGRF